MADLSFDARDLTAAVVDLAVRGVLVIDMERAGKKEAVVLRLRRDRLDAADLAPWERQLVTKLFGEKEEVALSALKFKFHSHVPTLRKSVFGDLVRAHLLAEVPETVAGRWTAYTVLACGAMVGLGWIADVPIAYWFLSVVVGVLLFVIARHMPQRTGRGRDALARIRGLEEYVTTAEKERLEKMPADHFERVLPYAIALGVSDRWTRAFEGLLHEPPDWYRGSGGWSGFHTGLQGLGPSIQHTMLAAPRAAASSGAGWSRGGGWSGGGGGFSGGFSGGGFGGGGGGGW
jgi:uncharacterized membrane protein YgcG